MELSVIKDFHPRKILTDGECMWELGGDGESVEVKKTRNKTKRQNNIVSSELLYDFLKSQKAI